MSHAPLTLGTAGHIDHGKTTLVHALTGAWTDRLPEERARGMTITLGYAALELPSGRRVSLVDVPGHERFVRTMVAGASGIDLFLLVVAADDGVMPQTTEHVAVLRALGVEQGVIAVTKADAADPSRAVEEAARLIPGKPVVVCSARTGVGLATLRDAIDAVAAATGGRLATAEEDVVLHVDRSFAVAGRGTVVTGTLWSGTVAPGDRLEIAPRGIGVRVRGVHVHDAAVPAAAPGQRVALNLVGARARDAERGDVLMTPGALEERRTLDCVLSIDRAWHGCRVQIHHGTRHAPARVAHLADDLWQVRLERPLLARDGEHVVVRRHAPPDTVGGGRVLDASAERHGRGTDLLARLRARRDGVAAEQPVPRRPASAQTEMVTVPATALAAAEAQLRDAGLALLAEGHAVDPSALRALRITGVAVRLSGRLYGHADVVERAVATVVAMLEQRGSVALAEVRDDVTGSRRTAQALLEHLDATRITRRGPDDRRTLRRRVASRGPA